MREYRMEPGQPLTMTTGHGLRVEERSEAVNGLERTVRTRVRDNQGRVASDVEQVFRRYAWGEELVREVVDPNGDALVTRKSYYEQIAPAQGAYEKELASIERPDGSWTRFYYDDYARTVSEVHGWLDAPATAPESQARVIRYGYQPLVSADQGGAVGHRDFRRPRTVTELVQGVVVSKTLFAFMRSADGSRVEVDERCARPDCEYGDADNLRTVRHYAAEDGADPQRNDSGKLVRVEHPDGRVESYVHERGTVQDRVFTAGEGDAMRTTVTHGTVASPDGIAYETTRERTLVDDLGRTVRQETEVYKGGGYEPLSWTEQFYDARGRLERTERSNGEVTTAQWGCCTQEQSVDSRGIETLVLSRDGLDRVTSEQRAGVTTQYTYDAEGRRLTTTRSGGLSSLSSGQSYDMAGRLDESIDEQGLVTGYDYELGGRRTIVTRPGGFTEVSEQYADGQSKSVTGDAVVAQHFTHGVNPDGTRWTEVRVGRADSPMFERTVTDLLGRTVRVERPGFDGTLEVAETFYNDKGQVERTRTTGLGDTLYAYDELGRQVRTGLDVDGDGVLDLTGQDRIRETFEYFERLGDDWWSASEQRVYAAAGTDGTVTTNRTRTRLTGLGAGGLVSEQVTEDVHGNQVRSTVLADRAARTEVRRTDVPDSTQDAVSVSEDGRLRSSTSATGVTVSYDYDGLGRRRGVTDPRTGRSETVYDPVTGRVQYVQDAAGHPTHFGYDPVTGRKVSECNALAKCTYFEHDARGQLVRTWGDVPYPVQYVYDDYGRRVEMHTFRDDSFDWSDVQWPEGSSIAADVTTWQYEEATGLLLAKIDAAGAATTYTYGAAGRLATRTWARPRPGGGALVTTYGYDDATGELLSVNYNDSTPDVTYSYDRLGRQATVQDGVGLRSFAYAPDTLQLESETITGTTPAVLTRHYAPSGPVIGRATGLTLGADYSVSYGYAGNGRFESVGWTVNGQSDNATYSYEPDSDLLGGYVTSSGLAVSYEYEPQRDLKTQVRNSFGGSVVSQYDYRYDAIGRRTSVENSGSAFAATRFTSWGYDDRNQVTASNRYTGSFTASPNPANEVAAERRGYTFDPIGNRESALAQDGETPLTYAANELNQYDTVGQQAPVYDEDGNLLNDGTKVLAYNAENQLVRVEVPGVSVSTFDYDYIGRRVRKSVDLVSGDDYVVTWVYAGWNKVEERKTVGSTTTMKNFVWGLDLSQSMEGAGGIGGLIAVVDGGGSASLFAYDGNGNVSELISASTGSTAAHYEYDAFGNVIVATGTAAADNAYRFSTRYADDESGLVYYGYRYYDAGVGRWVNRDPIGERGGINLYVLLANLPVSRVDSLGLEDSYDAPPRTPPTPEEIARDHEDGRALDALYGARVVAGLLGYDLTEKFLGRYLSGAGDYVLSGDEMRLIRDDRYFAGNLGKVSRYVIERVECGKGSYDIGWEHLWFKDTTPHLWSAFNKIRVKGQWDGTVSEYGHTRHFDGTISISVEDYWTFGDPARAGRKPFAHYEWLPDPIRQFEEGRFMRLEQRGWAHPFWIRGQITTKYYVDVDTTVPAASLSNPAEIEDRGTRLQVVGL